MPPDSGVEGKEFSLGTSDLRDSLEALAPCFLFLLISLGENLCRRGSDLAFYRGPGNGPAWEEDFANNTSPTDGRHPLHKPGSTFS